MERRAFIVMALAAVGWPLALRAQQKAMPVIGYLSGGSPGPSAPFLTAFLQGLGDAGYIEGQNVTIEYRSAENNYDRLPALAANLAQRRVDVIVSTGGMTRALAAKHASSTIPIVFIAGDDPVERGLIASLARPSGNLTGVSMLSVEVMGKRLELLSDLLPQAKVIALLVNPNNAGHEPVRLALQEAARAKGVQLDVVKASAETEIDAAFAALSRLQVGAVIISTDPFFDSRREQLIRLATHHAVPAISESREFAAAGGLISYGPSFMAAYRQAGIYTGKILKGAKPADLPVEQPTTFELVVNLKTAKALGLTVPPAILARATEVIE